MSDNDDLEFSELEEYSDDSDLERCMEDDVFDNEDEIGRAKVTSGKKLPKSKSTSSIGSKLKHLNDMKAKLGMY